MKLASYDVQFYSYAKAHSNIDVKDKSLSSS